MVDFGEYDPTPKQMMTPFRRQTSGVVRRPRWLTRTLGALCVVVSLGAITGCSQPLGAVGGIQVTPNNTSLELSWNPVPGASGYLVYLDTSADVSPSQYSVFNDTSMAQVTIKGLTVGKTYYCMVVADSMGGLVLGPSSEVVSVNLSGSPATTGGSTVIIEAVTAYPGTGGQVLLAATANDSTGASLTYTWSVDTTALASQSPQVVWQGTVGSGNHTATVTVSDGTTSVSQSVSFTI